MNEINRLIKKNVVSNYILIFCRLVAGILMIRWMFHYLGVELYGFWALLWSFFVYVLIFDFGFSSSAKKCTAEGLHLTDIQKFNRMVTSVLALQWIMSLSILLITGLALIFLPQLTQVHSPDQLSYLRLVLIIFGIGIALTFPTGVFPEILVGMKLIYLKNNILIVGKLVECAGIYLIFQLKGSLLALTVFTVSLNIALNVWMYFLLRRRIKGFRLGVKADLRILKELAGFSLFVYLSSIANMVINKTDRLILSIFSGLESVGWYQLGSRLPEIGGSMFLPYQENIAPFTADLCKQNRIDILQSIALRGVRFTNFLAAGGAAIAMVLTPELVLFLLGSDNPMVLAITRVLAVSVLISVSFRGIPTKMMLMSGHHRLYCLIAGLEAVMNLSLSLFLLFRIGTMGVVYGTLIPNILLSFFISLPFFVRFTRYPLGKLLYHDYLKAAFCGVIAGVVMWGLKKILADSWLLGWRLLVMLSCGGIVYLISSYLFFFTARERREILFEVTKRFVRKKVMEQV